MFESSLGYGVRPRVDFVLFCLFKFRLCSLGVPVPCPAQKKCRPHQIPSTPSDPRLLPPLFLTSASKGMGAGLPPLPLASAPPGDGVKAAGLTK